MHQSSPYLNTRQESAAARGFFRIGEVSRLTDTKPFVLRYWETEFPMLQPVKSPKGHRLYRHEDVETVRHIKHLLYNEGFTIAGARRHLSEGGGASAFVADAAPVDDNFGGAAAPLHNSAEETPAHDTPAPNPAQSELPGTQELSGARLSSQSLDNHGAATGHTIIGAVADPSALDRAATDRAADGLLSERALSERAAVGRAIVDRKVLLDLRDALRSLLTLLETE